jgi:hypothetical protein
MLESVILKEVTTISGTYGASSIGDNAFDSCESLKNVKIPSTVKEIGNEAFYGCNNLTDVEFADISGVNKIGESAFSYCASLKSFDIPTSVKALKNSVFRGCEALETIVLPESVTAVGEEAFAYCDSLKKIDVYADNCSFYNDSLTTDDTAVIYCNKSADYTISYAEKFGKPYVVYCTGRLLSHSFKTTSLKAKPSSDGYIKQTCSSCGYVKTVKISKIASVKLQTVYMTYNLKTQYPKVSVKDGNSKTISGANYYITRLSGCKYVGRHAVKITFKGNYAGSVTRYYNIVPKSTSIKRIDSYSRKLRVNWYKQPSQTTGYQIQLSTSKSFKNGVKTVTLRKNFYTSFTVSSLAPGKGYYIRIRTFKRVGKSNFFSSWSVIRGRKTK